MAQPPLGAAQGAPAASPIPAEERGGEMSVGEIILIMAPCPGPPQQH